MSSKRQQTFAKMTRERKVKEKRERKAEKKAERAALAADGAEAPADGDEPVAPQTDADPSQ